MATKPSGAAGEITHSQRKLDEQLLQSALRCGSCVAVISVARFLDLRCRLQSCKRMQYTDDGHMPAMICQARN